MDFKRLLYLPRTPREKRKGEKTSRKYFPVKAWSAPRQEKEGMSTGEKNLSKQFPGEKSLTSEPAKWQGVRLSGVSIKTGDE